MYRSIEHGKFPEFQTGIFVKWKAPLMSYQTSSKRSPPFWLLIGARKLVFFWHQSETRTAATVWNWSGKTLSPGALLAVLYFSSCHIFFRPFRLFLVPTICPWASEDGSAYLLLITAFFFWGWGGGGGRKYNNLLRHLISIHKDGYQTEYRVSNLEQTINSCSLKFIRLLRVVFSSQQRLNRPADNAVQ